MDFAYKKRSNVNCEKYFDKICVSLFSDYLITILINFQDKIQICVFACSIRLTSGKLTEF